jgi:hypothetical protein
LDCPETWTAMDKVHGNPGFILDALSPDQGPVNQMIWKGS